MRCEHRFELEALPCPHGCHDAQLIEALQKHESLRAAADSLNWPRVGHFHQRARMNPRVKAEVVKRMKVRRFGNGQHPGFVEEKPGNVHGSWTVLKRLPNHNGNAVWLCQRAECGHTQSIQGIALRSGNPRCKTCKGGKHG